MNLVTRFLAARRDKLLMRLGCWLVCFSLVLGLMLPQQRAEALVAELSMTAVASLAAAYLGACGLSFVTQGMDKDALVSSVQRLIQEFLDTELGGKSIQDWLGNVWDLAVIAGKLIMGRPLTDEMMGFAQWVAGKYAAEVGENLVYSDKSVTFADGSVYNLAIFGEPSPGFSDIFPRSNCQAGTSIPVGTEDSPTSIELIPGSFAHFRWYTTEERVYFSYFSPFDYKWYDNFVCRDNLDFACFCLFNDMLRVCIFSSPSSADLRGLVLVGKPFLSVSETKKLVIGGTDLSIDRAPSMSYIPEGIEAEQGIALDVGAAATMDLDQVCQGVLEGVLEGTLTSIMEIAEEAVVNPPAGEITDVDNLGLPALGQALTSRFPFSIPWDFFRAVQLLAAPAKAPRFEVDFMQPIEHRVGQWQGDTKVVLDFSEYAIIGQISRWTSTIGFCLMLAGATKRLIWTA